MQTGRAQVEDVCTHSAIRENNPVSGLYPSPTPHHSIASTHLNQDRSCTKNGSDAARTRGERESAPSYKAPRVDTLTKTGNGLGWYQPSSRLCTFECQPVRISRSPLLPRALAMNSHACLLCPPRNWHCCLFPALLPAYAKIGGKQPGRGKKYGRN